MGPFLKTLVGDTRNAVVVGVVLAIEFALVRMGLARAAVIVIPLATMVGVTWLASR